MKLADEKKCFVQEAQRRVTSSEFVDWLVYYEEKEREELESHSKQDHYFAMLGWRIREVLEVLCETPANKRTQLKDMLLKFDGKPQDTPKKKIPINPYHARPGVDAGIEIGKTKLTLVQQVMADREKMRWIGAFGPPQMVGEVKR